MLVAACAIGIGSFVVSFLSGIMAIKIIALLLEAGTARENCPWLGRLDYALTQVITDVLPNTVHYIEQFLPAIVVPGHDEGWPLLLRYPFYGMIIVPLLVLIMFVTMVGVRVVSDVVERRNENEARRLQAEAAAALVKAP